MEESHQATWKQLRELIGDGGTAAPARKRRRKHAAGGRAIGGGRAQWKRIIELEDLASQGLSAVSTVRRFGDDAEKFLNSRGSTHRIMPFPDNQTGDAFATRYNWTVWRVGQKEASHVYTLFSYLFWFDFVKVIHPAGTGRVGVQMERRMRSVVGQIAQGSNLVPQDVSRQAKAWSIRGRKLNHICERYGDGVILFLHKELSDDL